MFLMSAGHLLHYNGKQSRVGPHSPAGQWFWLPTPISHEALRSGASPSVQRLGAAQTERVGADIDSK